MQPKACVKSSVVWKIRVCTLARMNSVWLCRGQRGCACIECEREEGTGEDPAGCLSESHPGSLVLISGRVCDCLCRGQGLLSLRRLRAMAGHVLGPAGLGYVFLVTLRGQLRSLSSTDPWEVFCFQDCSRTALYPKGFLEGSPCHP